MKITGWRFKEVVENEMDKILANGNLAMLQVIKRAKELCPVGKETIEGKFVERGISFVRKKGKGSQGKGSIAQFQAKVWTGRYPGQLRDTIRLVRSGRQRNLRVYAGNYKVNYAHMVERGTIHTKKKAFLRPAFNEIKPKLIYMLKTGTYNG